MDLFILIIINLILMAVFFVVFFVYFRQKFQDHWDDQKYLQGLREEVNEMIKELNITTNRNVDLMEAKVQEVKEILGSAQLGTKALGAEIKNTKSLKKFTCSSGAKTWGVGHRTGVRPQLKATFSSPVRQSRMKIPTLLNFALSPALPRLITKRMPPPMKTQSLGSGRAWLRGRKSAWSPQSSKAG
jgi:hypothetical protein